MADYINYETLIEAMQNNKREVIDSALSIQKDMFTRDTDTRGSYTRIIDFCNAYIIESAVKNLYTGADFMDSDTHVNYSATYSSNPDILLATGKTLEVKSTRTSINDFISNYTAQSKYKENNRYLKMKDFNNTFGSTHNADKLLVYSKEDDKYIVFTYYDNWYDIYDIEQNTKELHIKDKLLK